MCFNSVWTILKISNAVCVNEINSSDNIENGFCAGAWEPLYLAYLHYEPRPLLIVIIIIIIIIIIMIIIRKTGPRSPSSDISSSSRRSPSTPAWASRWWGSRTGSTSQFPAVTHNLAKLDPVYDGSTFLNNTLFSAFPEFFCGRNDALYNLFNSSNHYAARHVGSTADYSALLSTPLTLPLTQLKLFVNPINIFTTILNLN